MKANVIPPILIVVFWLSGLVLSLMPAQAFEAAFFTGSILCLFAAAICSLLTPLMRREIILPKTPLLWLLLGFWVLAFISAGLSEVRYISLIYAFFLSALPLSVFIFLMRDDRAVLLKMAASGIACLYAVLSLSCLYQYFFQPGMLLNGFVAWPLANPNSLAALLSIGLFGTIGLMLSTSSRLLSNAALVMGLLILCAILTTGSRGGILSLVLILPPALWILRAHAQKHWRCLSIVAIGGALFVMAVYMIDVSGQQNILEIASRTAEGAMPLLWSRPDIWVSTWHIIQDHFWTGTGIGTYFLYYPEYGVPDAKTAGLMAHNDPLQFWAEMGVVAPVLFYCMIGVLGVRTFRALRRLEDTDPRRISVVMGFCALAAMGLHAHVSFNFYILPILYMAGIVLAFWFHATQLVFPKCAFSWGLSYRLFGDVVRKVCLVSLCVMPGGFLMLQGSYVLTSAAQSDLEQGNLPGFVHKANRAHDMSFGRNDQAYILAATLPMGAIEMRGPALSEEEFEENFSRVKMLLEKAQALNPRSAASYYMSAKLLFLKARYEQSADLSEVRDLLKKVLTLNPKHKAAQYLKGKIGP